MKSVKLIMILFILSFGTGAFAQGKGTLSGSVQDAKGQPLGFVNVAVLKAADNTIVTGTIADMEGNFTIAAPAAGKYKLKITFLGYQALETALFEVTGEGKNFGTLILAEDAQVLKEVTVQAMRPTVVAEADKMVVSVEGTALAGGSTAYEVLTKSPGVWVDQDGSIKLNGKAGVQVMLNGKPTYLSAKELQNILQSMPAENIKNLEIIANPSAKYEAEGTSGILNINLKKNETKGMNGSAYAGYQHNEMPGFTAGANLNYKQGKWNSVASLDLAERTFYRTNNMQRTYSANAGQSLEQEALERNRRFVPALRLGTDYELNSKHSIGLMASAANYRTHDNIRTSAWLRDGNPQLDLYIDALNKSETKYNNNTLNLHYLGKLDTMGTTLSADADFVTLVSEDMSTFRNTYDSLGNNSPLFSDLLLTENPAYYIIYSGKTDFSRRLGKTGKLELGAKGSYVKSDNELRFYESVDGQKHQDDSRSNHFIYEENIYAAYANYSATFGKKWSLQAGLRAEQTNTKGNSKTLSQTTKRSYLDLFPSLFVQQNVNDNYQISYSFSRRINRPRYENLNPFVFYIDPYSLVIGNPQLKPQYTNAFTVTQTLKQNYMLVLGYAKSKDFVTEIHNQVPGEQVVTFQQQNVDDATNMHATLVAPVRLSNNWQMSNTATIAYQSFAQQDADQLRENEQVSFSAQTTQNVQLPKDIKMEVNAAYQGPAAYGFYNIDASWWLDAGVKRSFLQDKLEVSLAVTDIFRTRRFEGDTMLNGNGITSQQYHGTQSFRINLRYRFSKGSKFEEKSRNSKLEEVERAGQ